MKKFYVLLCLIFLATPLWADDDDLTPESLSQASKEYESFFQTERPDPMNHEVWKLYVFSTLTSLDAYSKSANRLLTGLTPNQNDQHFVVISTNLLYNFMTTIPQRGDVIVIDGRVQSRNDKFLLRTSKTDHYFKEVYMYAEGGKILTNEHAAIIPFSSPNFTMVNSTLPIAGATPVVSTQGISIR